MLISAKLFSCALLPLLASLYYYSNDVFFEAKGPIFLVVGSLSALTEPDYRHPVWIEMAQRAKGFLYVLQHRFHGKSRPSIYTTEYLHYLNSEQALYDIERFICFVKKEYNILKWIILGESHGGKLAVWFRFKFPHLVEGAVAVNAPLIPRLEFKEFFDIVNRQLSTHTGVMDTIKDAYKIVADDIANDRFDELIDNLKLCSNPGVGDKSKNIRYMFWSVTWYLGLTRKLKDTKNASYKTSVLNAFKDPSQTNPAKRLKKALEITLSRFRLSCLHVNYEEAVELLKNPYSDAELRLPETLISGLGNRQFFWQSCTEFGYMKTSTKDNMFGDVPLDFFIELCKDVFGEWYDKTILEKSIQMTNIFYDGKDIDATKILFINYDGDDEKILTISKNDKRDFTIINIPDVPDTPKELTIDMRVSLTQKYDAIYGFIKEQTGVEDLLPPDVDARRVPDLGDKEDKLLIQFMSSFTNVKQVVDNVVVHYGPIHQLHDQIIRTEKKHWNQRYFKNKQFYEVGGPLILVLGELSALSEPEVKHPVWTEMAQRCKGVLFVLEHRYFGRSQPTPYDTEYLQYLNSEQALYDIIFFAAYFKTKYMSSDIIVVGEGHGGKLAAWSRLKFPTFIEGAVVVNAPLVLKLEFREYFDVVEKQLSTHKGVMDTIKEAYTIVADDLANDRFNDLIDKLKLCNSPANPIIDDQNKNIQYMLWSISWNLGSITVLEDSENVSYKSNVLKAFENDLQSDPVYRLRDALEIILNRFHLTCIHVNYKEAVELLQDANPESEDKLRKKVGRGLGNRQHFWHSCVEFGYMKTSTKDNMFGNVPLDFFIGLCRDTFGTWYSQTILEKSIKTTNMFYAGKDIEASKILFINYDNLTEKVLTISENNLNSDFKIINAPDVPDTHEELTMDMRVSLLEKYNDIYNYIKDVTGVHHLEPPNVEAHRVLHADDEENKIKLTDIGDPIPDDDEDNDHYEEDEHDHDDGDDVKHDNDHDDNDNIIQYDPVSLHANELIVGGLQGLQEYDYLDASKDREDRDEEE